MLVSAACIHGAWAGPASPGGLRALHWGLRQSHIHSLGMWEGLLLPVSVCLFNLERVQSTAVCCVGLVL